jgi:MFS family permease
MLEFLDKKYALASPGFNRWLIPPAALAIHLCIGMAYGFSVFWLPLSQSIGVDAPLPCPQNLHWWEYLYRTDCDWPISMLGWTYTLFFVLLGSSAALWGGWVEKEGPRKAGFISACCWCGGLLIAAAGIRFHQLWLLWLGSGFIGGVGLGLGYISPISTLIKWFPDRRGMATGMAIMGFGGGAMIGAPLANQLMEFFSGPAATGVWQTFCVLAVIYFIFMVSGALGYRVPLTSGSAIQTQYSANRALITAGQVDVHAATKTKQFWLLWIILCVNVTAGIGILGMASPLMQEIFGGKLISSNLTFHELNSEQKKIIAQVAAGFTGLLSLFNIAGRFFWSTLSDRLGRKNTYHIFLGLGCLLYWAIPFFNRSGNIALFAMAFCIILSMYGGGFATIPAYLSDLFGTRMVSAIHGRLLTAWATAGILGPVLVNYIREYQLGRGIPAAEVYNITLFLLGGLLIIGLVCNAMVRPVNSKFFLKDDSAGSGSSGLSITDSQSENKPGDIVGSSGVMVRLILSWFVILIPLGWGIYMTLRTVMVLIS